MDAIEVPFEEYDVDFKTPYWFDTVKVKVSTFLNTSGASLEDLQSLEFWRFHRYKIKACFEGGKITSVILNMDKLKNAKQNSSHSYY